MRFAAVAAGALLLAGPAAAAGAPLSATTSLEPERALFGDRIAAVATVVVDEAGDPADVHVVAAFGPLDLLSGPLVERERRGGKTVLRYRWVVACLSEDCVPSARPHPIVLPRLRVTGGGAAAVTVPWPALSIAGRVSASEAAAATPPFRLETELPPPSYRAAPGALAAILIGVAAGLVLVAGLLIAFELVRRRRRREEERFALLSPLERAILLAREAERRGPADRRRALGLLARVLRTTESSLGGATAELAWSPPEPSPEQVEAVVGAVEQEIG